MKLIKIGRSSSCNMVLPSDRASSLHAELLVLDNGEIYLEDKNSTNGTFVGNKRITANSEIQVRRGDYIRFADVELNWAFVPTPDKKGNFKSIINIGTHHRNDITITGAFASRFHAVLKIAKNGKVFIRDNGSRNGTVVNGAKINPNQDVRIKRGDQIVCGDTDITEEVKAILPNPFGWVKTLATACLAVALLIGGYYLIKELLDGGGGPEKYRPAVVYVRACYHPVAIIEDNPMPGVFPGEIELHSAQNHYQATAFFIDRQGHMATNRHVAQPWAQEYSDEQIDNHIRGEVKMAIEQMIPVSEIRTSSDSYRLQQTELGESILAIATLKYPGNVDAARRHANTIIRRLKNSPIKITGKLDYITVGYPGRYYTHTDEFDRCYVVTTSDTDDKDIAILQLNNKKTPSDIPYIFDVKRFREDRLEPLKDELYVIGYPHGLQWNMDEHSRSLEPIIRETKCSRVPSRYSFECQAETGSGASGSPIFDKKGCLVGIHWGSMNGGATYGLACQARYLKDLYDTEIGL